MRLLSPEYVRLCQGAEERRPGRGGDRRGGNPTDDALCRVQSEEQLDRQTLHRAHDRLVGGWTRLINQAVIDDMMVYNFAGNAAISIVRARGLDSAMTGPYPLSDGETLSHTGAGGDEGRRVIKRLEQSAKQDRKNIPQRLDGQD